MASARRFLEMGKRETRDARAHANRPMEQQAAEKVFHALEEALTGRVQKYGRKPPGDHVRLRNELMSMGDTDLADFFWDCFLKLHVGMWYRGVVQPPILDKLTAKIEATLDRIERDMRRR
jgi:hypothetical protein